MAHCVRRNDVLRWDFLPGASCLCRNLCRPFTRAFSPRRLCCSVTIAALVLSGCDAWHRNADTPSGPKDTREQAQAHASQTATALSAERLELERVRREKYEELANIEAQVARKATELDVRTTVENEQRIVRVRQEIGVLDARIDRLRTRLADLGAPFEKLESKPEVPIETEQPEYEKYLDRVSNSGERNESSRP